MIYVRIFLIFSVFLLPQLLSLRAALACGWWGDSEMSSRRDNAFTSADGRPLAHTLNIQSMKLPGRMGFGIAVPEPGRAIPYLLATFGQPLTRIGELKIFGFRTVIDLGTPAITAHLHRAETEEAGMQYFSIPIKGDIPNPQQISFYNRIVINANNGPLLVYAPKAELLAIMWASYRISLGSPLEFALAEGKALGLTREQETELRNRVGRSN